MFRPKRRQGRFPFLRLVIPDHSDRFSRWSQIRMKKTKLQFEKRTVGFGRTEVSAHHSKALREIFRMGMVSGVLVLMGVAKLGFFIIFWPFFLTLVFYMCFESFPTVSQPFSIVSDRFPIFFWHLFWPVFRPFQMSWKCETNMFGLRARRLRMIPNDLEKQGPNRNLLFGFSGIS